MKLRLLAAMVLIVIRAPVALPQAKYPPETRNAALRYWLAIAEMKDPPADKATLVLMKKTSLGEAAWDEAKFGPILDANSEAIRMMQRATKLPECDWGVEYDRGARAALPNLAGARALARLNQLAGVRAMVKGDSHAAVDAWLAGVRFPQHIANVGALIFVLVAKDALLENLRAIAAATKQGRLSDTQKKQVSAALKELRQDGFDWGATWGLEEVILLQILGELRSSTNPRAAYESLMGEPLPHGVGVPSLEDTARFRKYMASVQTALNLPPDTAKARLLTLETQKRALPEALQRLIPPAQRVNGERLEIVAARKELLETLAAK